MNKFRETFEWRRAMRDQRRLRQLSQAEVARRAGLSPSAIKAYEAGERHPSPEALKAIIDAVGIPVEDANPILAGAGYAIDWRDILNQRYEPRDIESLAEEVEHYRWPVFVTNEASDVVCANRSFRSLIGIDRREQLTDKSSWNFLARASDPALADCLESWDESMSFMIGLAKGETRRDINLERPAPPTMEPFRRFLEGDPRYVSRLLGLWQNAPAVPHTTRMRYPVRYRTAFGDLARFQATMHVADVWQTYSWHDWVPEDAATWEALDRIRD